MKSRIWDLHAMTSSNFKSSICRSIKCVNHREQPSETDATYNGRDGKTNLRIMKRTINPTQLNKLRYRSRSIKNQQSIENHPDHQLLLQTSPNTDMMQSVRTQTPDYISESTRTNTSSRIITGPNPRQKTNILDQYEHSNKKEYLIDSNMIGNIANRSQQQQLRQLYCYGKIHKLSKHHISDSPNRKCGFNIIKSRSCLSMTASLPRNILIVVILHSLLSHLTLFNSPSPTVNYSPIPNLFARHTTVNAGKLNYWDNINNTQEPSPSSLTVHLVMLTSRLCLTLLLLWSQFFPPKVMISCSCYTRLANSWMISRSIPSFCDLCLL